jgi:hypothetical protein
MLAVGSAAAAITILVGHLLDATVT